MKWYLCNECGNVWGDNLGIKTCAKCGDWKNVWDITDMPEYKHLIERAERAVPKQGVKLSKYLADYIEHEIQGNSWPNLSTEGLQHIIQQGIEAFASTEDAVIDIRTKGDNIPLGHYE